MLSEFALCAIEPTRPEITFASKIEFSRKNKILFADVVSMKGATRELILTLEKLMLFENKNSEFKEQVISNTTLSRQIKEIAKNNEVLQITNPIFRIPTTVTFTPVQEDILSNDEIRNRLSLRFSMECPSCSFAFSKQNKIDQISGNWELDYSNIHIKPSLLLPLVGSSYKSFRWLSIKVSVKDLIPVATTDLPFGKLVESDDFRLEERTIGSLSERFSNIENLTSFKIIQPIKAGEPILPKMVKREPSIHKGELVKGILGNDNFEIQGLFISEEDGFKGEKIKVKSTEHNKQLSALVLTKELVRIQE